MTSNHQKKYMSRLNDADYVVDEIMQIFADFNDKKLADYSPTELIESSEFNSLLNRLLRLNEDIEMNYSRLRYEEGMAIVQAFRYAQFDEPYQDSYNFEAPRFNEGAFLA